MPGARPGTGILPGTAALIIEPGRVTVPSLLKQAGYATGVVGKWHLGLGAQSPTDYNGEIKPGPLEIGFDYAWLLPATGDRTPCVWVENHRVVGLDPADPDQARLLRPARRPGVVRQRHPAHRQADRRQGGALEGRRDRRRADRARPSRSSSSTRTSRSSSTSPRTTSTCRACRTPGSAAPARPASAATRSTSSTGPSARCSPRSTGCKLADNTLVIVTSDNGGVLDTNGPDIEHGGTVETNNGHAYNGPLRAGKGSAYEGGTRVPFIARWPGHIKPGVSDELICHVDMLATLAALTGQTLPADAGPDSFNVLPALLGEKTDKPCRDHLVEHGNVLAIRKGPWKLIPAVGGGGQARRKAKAAGPGTAELYNLADDIGETKNLAAQHPEIVKEMTALLQQVRENGRSRP